LIKVQDAASWRDVTLPRWHPATVTPPNNGPSASLVDFLDRVVSWVNANPAVLNKHYTGRSDEASGNLSKPSLATKLGLSMAPGDEEDPNNFDSVLAGLKRSPINFSHGGLPSTMVMMGGPMVQAGGSNETQRLLHKSNHKFMGAELIESVFAGLMGDLRRENKELDRANEQAIINKINTLKTTQLELLKSLNVIDEYGSLLDIVGPYADDQTVVNVAHMQKFRQNYERLLGSQNNREQQLVSVLQEIKKLINPQAYQVDAQGIGAGIQSPF
jgi:hypothetical protein